MEYNFENSLKYVQSKITNILKSYISNHYIPATTLKESLRYILIDAEGKKYRPFLLWILSKCFELEEGSALNIGAALEMLHTYSLVHDDLPAMDNDDYRRGKLTLHKKYNESTAILTGDALLTDCFYYIANINLAAEVKIKIISKVTEYLGSSGMVSGQILDIIENNNESLDKDLDFINLLKTAKFFELICVIVAIISNKPLDEEEILKSFGLKVGEAFQLKDDLEDNIMSVEKREILLSKLNLINKDITNLVNKLNIKNNLLDEFVNKVSKV